MAVTPQNSDAFQREVNEELRRDQLRSFWVKRGMLLIGLVVVALAAFGGWLYWQHSQTRAAETQGERFSGALDDLGSGAKAKAEPVLADLAQSGNPGYSGMARMTQADIALANRDLKKAAEIFGTMAADTRLPQPIRDIALIRQTAAESDTIAPAEVIRRLGPLAKEKNPFLGSAGEMVAVAHLRLNQRREAAAIFKLIAQGETVPESLRSRAVQMAGVLGVDAVGETKDTQAR